MRLSLGTLSFRLWFSGSAHKIWETVTRVGEVDRKKQMCPAWSAQLKEIRQKKRKGVKRAPDPSGVLTCPYSFTLCLCSSDYARLPQEWRKEDRIFNWRMECVWTKLFLFVQVGIPSISTSLTDLWVDDFFAFSSRRAWVTGDKVRSERNKTNKQGN